MKRHNKDSIGQPNLLQALHKNKIIQSKLAQRQRIYQAQFIKEMDTHNLNEKYNRELLYAWKKEMYVRQQRKFLQEYVQQRHGIPDEYYEHQMKSLENIIAGQQTLVIPPSEEERRLTVNTKYHEFLENYPVEIPLAFRRTSQSAAAAAIRSMEQMEIDSEVENIQQVEQSWKYLHAQSAVGSRRRHENLFPTIPRSTTAKEMRRMRESSKTARSVQTPASSSRYTTTDPTLISFSSSSRTFSNVSTLPEGIEPLVINSETIQKATRADLLSMRSVRRPKKSPGDVHMIYEARKKIYQINRHALELQTSQRKAGFTYTISTDRSHHAETMPEDPASNQAIEQPMNVTVA